MSNTSALIRQVKATKALPAPAVRRAIRESAGISQRRLADAIGVSVQAISHWKSGARHPRPKNAVAYAEALRDLSEVEL